jgi:hypothetical protein
MADEPNRTAWYFWVKCPKCNAKAVAFRDRSRGRLRQVGDEEMPLPVRAAGMFLGCSCAFSSGCLSCALADRSFRLYGCPTPNACDAAACTESANASNRVENAVDERATT